MNALELQEGLILKEKARFVDRDENSFVIIFSVLTKFGTITTEDLKSKETTIQVDLRKKDNPKLWKEMKDITDKKLMDFIMKNKDFEYFQTDETKTDKNEKEFEYLKPFYNTLFPYLKEFNNIKIIDI